MNRGQATDTNRKDCRDNHAFKRVAEQGVRFAGRGLYHSVVRILQTCDDLPPDPSVT